MDSKRKSYKIGDIVLGTVGRYQPWPAKVVDITCAPKSAVLKKGTCMVEFFGSHDFRHLTSGEVHQLQAVKYYQAKGRLAEAYADSIRFMSNQPDRYDLELRLLGCGASSSTSVAYVPPGVSTIDADIETSNESSKAASKVCSGPADGSMRGHPPFTIKPKRRHSSWSSSSSSSSSDSGGDQDYVPEAETEDDQSFISDRELEKAKEASSPTEADRISLIVDDVLEIALADTGKSKRHRRRIADPAEWKRNKAKAAKDHGQPYTGHQSIDKPARKPLPVDCSTCRFKCSKKFNEEDRIRICDSYNALGSFVRQKDFILKRMSVSQPKRRRTEITTAPRTEQWQYHLNKEESEQQQVCRKFLQATLGMTSDAAIRTAKKYRGEQNEFAAKDFRGHVTPPNTTSQFHIDKVCEHINSFPKVPPHYVRRDRTKTYLLPGLNKSKMHRLYVEWCGEQGIDGPVSKEVYLGLLKQHFNAGFFVPKKDQCLTCAKKNDLEGEELAKYVEEVYQPHRQRHQQAQEHKLVDKKRAANDESFHSATFDLQSVLYTPCSDVSVMYYKRKFSVYNLTVYEQSIPHDAHCYLWDECTGRRGANEICSSLIAYLSALPECVRHVSLFSDTCGGQNRNCLVAAGMLHHVVNSPTLELVDQKFLESGHSYMECDAMHSAIDFAKKHQKVYVPDEWDNIITGARRNKPYQVHHLDQSIIYDFRQLSKDLIFNRNTNTQGQKINWLLLKWIRYDQNHPNSIFCKVNYEDEFMEVVLAPERSHRDSRITAGTATLKRAYNRVLCISEAKKDDLLALVNSGAIPSRHRAFYESLPSSGRLEERLAEPSAEEAAEEGQDVKRS